MSEALSENAQRLLGRVVILGGEYPGGLVQGSILWEAADLKYEAYLDAAAELVEKGLAESLADASDFPGLKATPAGTERIRGN